MNIWMKPIPDMNCPVKVGDKVMFAFADDLTLEGKPGVEAKMRVGKVCEINQRHGWFDVIYSIRGHELRECFKFEDFGKSVQRYGK